MKQPQAEPADSQPQGRGVAPAVPASNPRDLPGLDVASLETWLRGARADLVTDAPLTAALIAGGRSNLTYTVDGATTPLVLRRPPLGHVQSTAHDMAREFRVISALDESSVPVPTAIAYLDDTATSDDIGSGSAAGVGAPFYLMGRAPGRILRSRRDNREYSREQVRALSGELMTTLAELHSIDPAEVGLADFGRPDGFLSRQVARWKRQYDGSRSRELSELDALGERLGAGIPETLRSSIVHGDFRLDNALVVDELAEGSGGDEGATPHISAILDWEMSTLGDSLTDLGLFGLYWSLDDFDGVPPGVVPSAVSSKDGYPSFAELVDVYASATGVSVPQLPWYLAFAAFKLAVILEGIHFRFQAGQTVGAGFEQIGSLVTPIARAGLRYLDEV